MAYSKEVFAAAMARLDKRRQAAEAQNKLTRHELGEKLPRLPQIERELAETGLETVRGVLTAGDAPRRIEALRKRNLALQGERAALLTSHGYPPEILDVNYYCHECDDTGFRGDRMCSCLRALLREEACKSANSGSPLPLSDFDSFDLSYYPDTPLRGQDITVRGYMGRVFSYCKNYAFGFDASGGSLLLLGATGLGKTHLALAIANTVLAQGHSVIYDTAQNIFMHIEDENFGRSDRHYTETAYECDLLILDELPDYISPFSLSTFYNLINTRMLAHRPMIVSTNLSENELSQRYGEKIFSRLIGDFMLLHFFGSDIRQLRLRQKESL